MKIAMDLFSIVVTIAAATGVVLSWVANIKWSKTSMDAKEDIIRQKEEKIRHLKEDREERLLLKDEQIKILELQLGRQRNKFKTSKKKARTRRGRINKRERPPQ